MAMPTIVIPDDVPKEEKSLAFIRASTLAKLYDVRHDTLILPTESGNFGEDTRQVVISPGEWIVEFQGNNFFLTSLDNNLGNLAVIRGTVLCLLCSWFPDRKELEDKSKFLEKHTNNVLRSYREYKH